MVLAALVAAGASIANNVIQARATRRQSERTADANMELAKYGYEQQALQIEKQNQYNSPASQMQRYMDAGLSPDLMYSQGNPGSQTSIPRYEPPQLEYKYSPIQIPEMLSQYQGFQMRQAQIDNVEAQTENVRSRTINENIRAGLLEIMRSSQEFTLEKAQQMFPVEYERAVQESRRTGASVEEIFQRMNLTAFELEKGRSLLPYEVAGAKEKTQQGMLATQQMMEQLLLMRQDQMLKVLEADTKRKQLSTMDVEKELKEAELLFNKYRNEWMKMGITTSDHPLMRIFSRMMNQSSISAMDRYNKAGGDSLRSLSPILHGMPSYD